jgi:hypothetical protein
MHITVLSHFNLKYRKKKVTKKVAKKKVTSSDVTGYVSSSDRSVE